MATASSASGRSSGAASCGRGRTSGRVACSRPWRRTRRTTSWPRSRSSWCCVPSRDLGEYRRKRDPAATPEPFGGPSPTVGSRFVVHKHSARRLHYDLRLEIDGVLKSWAVPKGPSMRSHEKRLAVHVEDHPVEYADFEGVIPEGNYGAGPSIVWDAGRFQLLKPEPASEQIRRGKLEFELFGFKLRGRWTLARMSGKDRDWLLLKKSDDYASETEPTERYPESVLSGLTIEELRDGATRIETLRRRLTALEAPRGKIAPHGDLLMLATLVDETPSDAAWLFEIKYDGVRVLASREGDEVELRHRSNQVVTARYPEVAAALRALPLKSFHLDGEIVALDDRGRSSFQRLQERMGLTRPADVERARGEGPVSAVCFDERALKTISEKLRPLARSTSPFARGTPAGRDHHWVDPELVGEVRFTEWTRDGGIRHPSFLGLREDKRPEECVRETAVVAAGEGAGEGGTARAASPTRPRSAALRAAGGTRGSHSARTVPPSPAPSPAGDIAERKPTSPRSSSDAAGDQRSEHRRVGVARGPRVG